MGKGLGQARGRGTSFPRSRARRSRPLQAIDGSRRIELGKEELNGRTFLLGNQGGFVLYLPVNQNTRERTLMPSKWFAAAGFGHCYLAATRVWVRVEDHEVFLDRSDQTGFTLDIETARRVYQIKDCRITQTYFVPDHLEAVVMTLEADRPAQFVIEPEYDMRYYQAFNADFSGYRSEIEERDGRPMLRVENHVDLDSPTSPRLDFYSVVLPLVDGSTFVPVPNDKRLRQRTYLKDEQREKVIRAACVETGDQFADEAPIWDEYSTCVYAPARISGEAPICLVFGFGDQPDEANEAAERVRKELPTLKRSKQIASRERLEKSPFSSGEAAVDLAYAQVLTRFNDALVARDMHVHISGHGEEALNAIFAGNKYFLDAWKRDENISLTALLLTGDFKTARAILDDTWRFQDKRTGRLPHIIRLGEPLVYYSSDGTLWALDRLWRYGVMSGDKSLLDSKYAMVEHFFAASLDFVQRGLLPSGGIVDKAYLWETWEDTPYTPRAGYPVEIELLWLKALEHYLPLIEGRNPDLAGRLKSAVDEGRETFKLFYLDGYLADSLSYEWEPQSILTPNGYIAFGLDYPLPSELAQSMIQLAREQLAGRVGVRSLAPRDWAGILSPEFMADKHNFQGSNMASVGIYNYHRGIEWPWLNPFFVAGELRYGDVTHAFKKYVKGCVHEALSEGGIGGISELYDIHGPLGADFQAWSMAGFIASLHEFGGIEVDALQRRVRIRPDLPDGWPGLSIRRRVGDSAFRVTCNCAADGQRVCMEWEDGEADGYSVAIHARLPAKDSFCEVRIDGEPVPPEQLEFRQLSGRNNEVGLTSTSKQRLDVAFSFRN